MKDNGFSYHLTKYFSDYLPRQTAASVNTIQSYRDTFVQLLSFYKQVYSLAPEKLEYLDFTSKRIEEFLTWLETERKVGIRTRNQRLAAIHAFFRYIQYRDPAGFGQCAEILSVPFKKAPMAPMTYMTKEEITLLFSIPDQRDMKQLRDLAIMILLYESGGRVQEIIDLCPRSIRFGTTNTVELHGKGNKTRLVPVNADAASIVRNYICRCKRTDVNEPLFVNRKGEKLTRAGIQYIIDKYVSIAREYHPELFRDRITNHSLGRMFLLYSESEIVARKSSVSGMDFIKHDYSSASESDVPTSSLVYRSAGIELTASCSSCDKELYHSSHSRVSSVKSDLWNSCP